MPLTPAQYTERRDTLAALLTETADTLLSVCDEAKHIESGLIQRHIEVLRAIRAKVFEDQFKLVLVARFQGGKSTTFNAVAMGGRVISPMGDGAIKCSASLISNRNCEDVSKRGVTLKWRTTEDLARLCEDVLTSGQIDLASPDGRRAARHAFEAEFDLYEVNRNSYPPTKLELLPIVDLITRFVGDARLTAMQERLAATPPSAAEIAELVRFPKDFSMRWPDQAATFTVDDARFVFLQGANMATDAPNLKQLGLEVIDCPGLFASSYDTTVATTMIATADAVWYLLDGKTAGQSDLEAIALCRQLAKSALFVSVNLKADINPTRKHITTKIIPHIQGQLQQAGLAVELQPYHALLALLWQTGESLLRGEEDADTAAFMHQLVDDWSLDAASTDAAGEWAALCEHLLDRLKSGVQEFRAAGGQFNAQTVALVGRESGLSDILGKLGQFVVEARARTILIERGVAQAISAIENGVEKPLAALEAAANLDEVTALSRFVEAESALQDFEKEVTEQLKFIEGNQGILLDRQLAGEFVEHVITAAVPAIARNSANEIVEKIGKLRSLSGLLGKRLQGLFGIESASDRSASILNKHFRVLTELRAATWLKELSGDTSPALKTMLEQATRINKTLEKFWKEAADKNPTLRDMSEPVLPQTTFDVSSFSDFLDKSVFMNVGGFLVMQGGISAILAGVAFFLPVIGTTFVVIATAVSIGVDLWRRYARDDDELREKAELQLHDTLIDQLKKQKEEIIGFLLPNSDDGKSLSRIRISIVDALQAPIKTTRQRFDSQRHDAEAMFQKKSTDRAQIAEDCRRLREERVVPLRLRLQDYKSETLPLC